MSEEEQVILTGWKSVAKACGLGVYTMRRWAKRYKMPYVRLCGRVTLPRALLIEWVRSLCEAVSKEDGREDEFVITKLKNLQGVKGKKRKKEIKRL